MAAIEQRWRTGEKLRFSGGRCNRESGGEPPFQAQGKQAGSWVPAERQTQEHSPFKAQGKLHSADLETGAKMGLCGACGLV